MKKTRLFLTMVFLLASVSMIVFLNNHKPRLLIVQSYDTSYAWSHDFNVGVERVLKKRKGEMDYSLRWFYMDTKRHPWDDYKVNTGLEVEKVIDTWQPDVVVAMDDDAQQFALKNYVDKPGISIVFAGVNSEASVYGYDKAHNVTGLLERLPLSAVRDTLSFLGNSMKLTMPYSLKFVGDKSETTLADEKYFSSFDWSPLRKAPSELATTFDEWKKAVLSAQGKVDFIVTPNYRKILRVAGGQDLVPPDEIMAWTEKNSRVPVIGLNVFVVKDGGMLAIGTSPFEQGEVAADMALDVLEGKRPSSMPIRTSKQFVVAMSASRLKARGIVLSPIFEAAARASDTFQP